MKRLIMRAIAAPVVLGMTVAGIAAAAPASFADGPSLGSRMGTPSQTTNDQAATSTTQGLWGDMPGGVAHRPYIQEMSLDNGAGGSTTLIHGGSASAPATSDGDVTAVVSPINLCKAGVAPSTTNMCYSTPNRVSIAVGWDDHGSVGMDLADPAVNQIVTGNTVIDLTIKLNKLGKPLRWTWANGDLVYWQTSNLGTDDASIRIKFKPAQSPDIDWQNLTPGNGCTATPIFNCNITKSQSSYLGANLILSLDDTMSSALTGSVFATQGAIAGFLDPGGDAAAPTLGLQIASAHFLADGITVQHGRLKAFLPSQTLLNLYGVLPSDAPTFFKTTRTGSDGSNDAPTFTKWTTANQGADGLLVDIGGITFSVPTYQVKGKAKALASKAKVKGKQTTITVSKIKKCAKGACSATVFRLGSAGFSSTASQVAKGVSAKSGVLIVKIKRSKLKKHQRYLIVVRYKSGKSKGKLLQSGIGQVN